PRVERGPPARLLPLDIPAPAVGAERPRVVVGASAGAASFDEEPAVTRRVPERARRIVGSREVEPHPRDTGRSVLAQRCAVLVHRFVVLAHRPLHRSATSELRASAALRSSLTALTLLSPV